MATTEAELLELLDAIDAQILAAAAGGAGSMMSYKKGEISVSKGEHISNLQKLRESYVRQLARLPAEETTVYDDPDE